MNLNLLKKALQIIKKAREYLNLEGVIGKLRAPRFLGYSASRRNALKSGEKVGKIGKNFIFLGINR